MLAFPWVLVYFLHQLKAVAVVVVAAATAADVAVVVVAVVVVLTKLLAAVVCKHFGHDRLLRDLKKNNLVVNDPKHKKENKN